MIGDGPSVVHLARFVNGYPFKPGDLGTDGMPVVRIRQLLDQQAEVDYAMPPADAIFIDNGDLVFAWSATLAVRVWRRGPALLNQHLFRVDTGPRVDRRWFGYVLEAGIELLKPLMHGSAMTHITNDMLRLLTVPVPPHPAQRAIADYLDAETARIDGVIGARRRFVELLEQRRTAVISDVVSGRVPIARSFTRAVVPRPLRAFADVDLGRAKSPETAKGDHMVPYLRAANVKNGRLDLSSVLEMNFTPEEQRAYALRPGDVLVSEGAGSLAAVGATAVWSGEIEGTVCFQNHLLRIRAASRSDRRFIAWWTRFAYESGLFASIATGAQILNLGADHVRSLSVRLPEPDAQRRIADFLDRVVGDTDALIGTTDRQIDLLLERRQALITAAVTGQLEIPGVAA